MPGLWKEVSELIPHSKPGANHNTAYNSTGVLNIVPYCNFESTMKEVLYGPVWRRKPWFNISLLSCRINNYFNPMWKLNTTSVLEYLKTNPFYTSSNNDKL